MKSKKIIISMSAMAAILMLYLVQKILPYHMLVGTISLGWILIFAAFVSFILTVFGVVHSDMKRRWKISLFGFLGFLFLACAINSFFTDDFMSLFHTSTIVKSPSADSTIVIVDTAEWSGTTFHIYKKKYGLATHLYTEYSETSFQTKRYKCKWSKDSIYVSIFGDEMEYHNFDVPLN